MLVLIHTSAQTSSANNNQVDDGPGGMFEINLRAGIPVGSFGTVTDAIPFGLSGALFFQPTKKIPIAVGADLGYMNYGTVRQQQTLDVEITANGSVINEFYIPLEITTSNNIFDGHLIIRSVAPINYFKPYLEGVFGFHYFWTATTVRDQSTEHYLSEPDNDVISSSTQLGDAAMSFGAGGGVIIEVNKNFGINLRADYLLGGRLKWFDKEDTQLWTVSIDNDGAIADPDEIAQQNVNVNALATESNTDMVTIQAGLLFTF